MVMTAIETWLKLKTKNLRNNNSGKYHTLFMLFFPNCNSFRKPILSKYSIYTIQTSVKKIIYLIYLYTKLFLKINYSSILVITGLMSIIT